MVKLTVSNCLIQAFSHLLCEERKKRGLTQFQLAKKSGLTRQSISLFESGRRVPTFFSMFNLAKGFGVPVAMLVSLFMSKVEYYEYRKRIPLVADNKRARWRT